MAHIFSLLSYIIGNSLSRSLIDTLSFALSLAKIIPKYSTIWVFLWYHFDVVSTAFAHRSVITIYVAYFHSLGAFYIFIHIYFPPTLYPSTNTHKDNLRNSGASVQLSKQSNIGGISKCVFVFFFMPTVFIVWIRFGSESPWSSWMLSVNSQSGSNGHLFVCRSSRVFFFTFFHFLSFQLTVYSS